MWYHHSFGRAASPLVAVAETHGHADHIGGRRSVIANFHPRELWTSQIAGGPEIANLINYAREQGLEVKQFSRGSTSRLGVQKRRCSRQTRLGPARRKRRMTIHWF
jgi:beta-lactamase superfamily II metal-dependent hydrolase